MNPNTLNSSSSSSANPTPASQSDSRSASQPSAPQVDCRNPQTQQDLNQCAAQSYEAADRELQALYEQMQGQMSETDRSQLVTAEEEWVEFRVAQCRLEAKPHEGGSVYPTRFYRCMERLTRDRIKQLQEQAQSEI